MKIQLVGKDPAHSKRFEGENLTYELKSGFIHIVNGNDERIGTFHTDAWAGVYYMDN